MYVYLGKEESEVGVCRFSVESLSDSIDVCVDHGHTHDVEHLRKLLLLVDIDTAYLYIPAYTHTIRSLCVALGNMPTCMYV
jgi:hypothetical protein